MRYLEYIEYLCSQTSPFLHVNHHSYNIAKFFIRLLDPILPSRYEDTFSFVQEIMNIGIGANEVAMAGFGVTSLFINFPVDETIEIIPNQLFSSCYRFHGLSRCEFTKFLHFLLSLVIRRRRSHCSHLGPQLAHIFVSFRKKIGFTTVHKNEQFLQFSNMRAFQSK